MGASNTMVGKRQFGNGMLIEYGTFTSSGGTSTLTIAADTTVQPEIGEILIAGACSDGDTAVKPALDQVNGSVKLTFTANDTGDYYIIGKAR